MSSRDAARLTTSRQTAALACSSFLLLILGCSNREPIWIQASPVASSAPRECPSFDSVVSEPPELLGYPSKLNASCYAWQLLTALNFPTSSDATGPVESSDEGPTRWESWKSVDEVFAPGEIESSCALAPHSTEVLSMASGISVRAELAVEKMLNINCLRQPVVDPWGQIVWTEVSIGPELAEFLEGFIAAYDGESLEGFEMPPNSEDLDAPSSMTLKAAWAFLGPRPDPTRYYVRNIVTFDDRLERCSRVAPMALVGLHLARKSRLYPGWIWMTFEHQENSPYVDDEAQMEEDWNFFRPDGWYWWDNEGLPWATQLVRMHPLDASAHQANLHWHQELGENSVWSNYMLIGVQWDDENSLGGVQRLANSVLEPWCQTRQEGCVGCHKRSTHDRSFIMAHLKDAAH